MRFVILSLLVLFQAPQERASIEGTVVKLGTSDPVTRARVVLTKQSARAGELLAFTTGGDGKFVFKNVIPGEYRIFVYRNGYLRAEYGQRGPEKPGVPITVVSRQELKDIGIPMVPTGTISGRVMDRYNEPVVNANVQAYKHVYLEGRRILSSFQAARTNDIGEYRLYWLPPGPYVVSAVPPEGPRSEGGSMLVEGGPGSPIRVNGGVPAGSIRLGGQVAAAMGLIDPTELGESYTPVFFPGTTEPSTASRIDLLPGANFDGVDLTVVETRAVSIRGTVISGTTGQPAAAVVGLVPRRTSIAGGAQRTAVVNPTTGAYEFKGILPGSYDLIATTNAPPAPPPPTRTTAPTARGPAVIQTALLPIDVGSSNLENVTLMLTPGFTVSGRITIEGRDPNQNQPEVARIGVELRPQVQAPGIGMSRTPTQPNGTFALQNISMIEHRLFLSATPSNSYIKVARLGSTDVLSNGLRLDSAPTSQLEVILSLNAGSLEAVVVDAEQKPVTAVTVALVPDPARRARFDNYRNGSTDGSGRLKIEGIIPGEYKLFAWEEVESNAWQDPDFIRQFEDRGRAIRIGEGAKETAELKVIPAK